MRELFHQCRREESHFIGVVDGPDTTLRFYMEASGAITVDIPAPEKPGSYSASATAW